ncbi:hypothetical protein OGV91_15035, partial [Citrobacter sp. Cf093]|nr:hypothetical protein [Citrobacter sp. Cf093]
LIMNPVPWLQMTNMISYQGLVRTFPNNMTGHCNIAPERKTDPGPSFDWARFRALVTPSSHKEMT